MFYLNNEIINISLFILVISFLGLIIVGNINGRTKDVIELAPLNVRKISLFISILTLYIVLIWWYMGNDNNWNNDNGAFVEISNVYGHILGLDSLSGWYLLLVGIILPITILSAWQFRTKESKLYYYTLLGLGLALFVNYLSGELISFYVLFECTLIPLFILIGLYGSSNREQAAYYILLYTLISSLFMLCSIILTKELIGLTLFTQVPVIIVSLDLQLLLWFGLFIAIMVKSPLYPLHTWLPVVHSESPLGGSILLAALVLKLTVYLVIRWLLPAFPEATMIYSPLVYTICIITIIIVSLITIIQTDLKVVVAYSSVSHMAVCMLGCFSNNIIGLEGGYLLSLAHGLVSPGLFIAVGGILYDRYHTRFINYYNGLQSFMPLFTLYFVILSFANIGTPLSANFLGEFFSLFGVFKSSPILGAIAASSILLSATYQMRVTSRITGGYSPYLLNLGDINSRESFMLISLILPTLFIGILPSFILDSMIIKLSSSIYFI